MNLRVEINEKIKKFFRRKRFVFFKRKEGILIFDDVIPSNLSPWRSNEFNHLLKSFPKSIVLTDLRNYSAYNQNNSFEENISKLENRYLYFKGKVKRLGFINLIFGCLGYTIFFFNIDKYFKLFEKKKIPFIFTLYPGGGFLLYNEFVNERLSVICKSNNFKGVIVNQFFVRDYLVKNGICDKSKINLIQGVPICINSYGGSLHLNKSTEEGLKILFFANKYTYGSTDKGWGIFLEISKKLIEKGFNVSFDIIGGFSFDDLDKKSPLKKFRFHGVLAEDQFCEVLNTTHILISPNSPNLENGAFDGFPLGTCVTGGFYYNALLMTDYFEEAEKCGWEDGKHFIKIKPNVENILEKVEGLIKNEDAIRNLAFNSHQLINKNYSIENQINKRVEIFEELIKNN